MIHVILEDGVVFFGNEDEIMHIYKDLKANTYEITFKDKTNVVLNYDPKFDKDTNSSHVQSSIHTGEGEASVIKRAKNIQKENADIWADPAKGNKR